jgi:putative NADH-flavin reductase
MKKIIVFGAAGGTGSEIVKQALDAGHQVTACVRNTLTFELKHANLTVFKGDVLDPGSFREAIALNDIVISALGVRSTKPTTLWSEGLKNIIAAMQANGRTRLICISAGGLDVNPLNNWLIRLLTRLVLQKILKEPYDDMRRMEREVKASGLDYTIIRPPRLLDKPATGNYRSSINSDLPNTGALARADVAHYIVHHLNDKDTFRSIVNVSY